MAYPVIDLPMYEPLKNLSSELFLPNINLIEQNSITLLETNQRFIESYMVGLNHEFARELLWREYPTDQRGTHVPSVLGRAQFLQRGATSTTRRSRRNCATFRRCTSGPKPRSSATTTIARQGGENEEELVLVIRGELLKRYPNAVIYAHRACWQRKTRHARGQRQEPCLRSGPIDNTQERRLDAAHAGRGGEAAADQGADAAV